MVPLAQFASTTLSLLLALATNIHCDTPYAKKVPQHLDERTTFYGGFALLDSTCATGLVNCGWPGCCPPSTVCDAGGAGGAHCCPDSNDCDALVDSIPVCADPSWSMWQGDGTGDYNVNGNNVFPKYFCCQADEIRLVNDLCVPSGAAVSTGLATLIVAGTGSGALSISKTSSPAVTTSGPPVTSAVEATTTAIDSKPTSSSSSKTGGGIGGIVTSIEGDIHPSTTSAASNAGDKAAAKSLSFMGIIAGIFGAALL